VIRVLPRPRTPDPKIAPTLRWGILGPGWIGQRFTAAMRKHTSQAIVAVGSRSASRAEDFAHQWDIPKTYGSYDNLLSDPDVDIVYISTPHVEHRGCALAALAAGKHVLVEKPLGINESQAAEVFAAARESGLFAGEAMWTKFLPKFDVIRQVIDDGVLGPIYTVLVDNGERFTTDHRIYDPALLGGPMLDMGIYPVSFAHWVLGEIDDVCAAGQAANAEVNGQFSAVLTHVGGNLATINTTIRCDTPRQALIAGEDAYVSIDGPYYQPGPFHVVPRGHDALTFADEAHGHEDGLHFAAVEAARRIADGERQSAIHPPSAVLATLRAMDRIRADIGVVYPGEEQQPEPTERATLGAPAAQD
jgi:predicted dehydrogenase